MKKLSMKRAGLTFEDACEKHLDDCEKRNLSESTIRHYRQGYACFFRFFDPNMPVSKINADAYGEFMRYLCNEYSNDVTINTYLRDFIVVLRFLMDEGDVQPFKMKTIKVNKNLIEIYTEEELQILLVKPNLRKCTFREYQSLP